MNARQLIKGLRDMAETLERLAQGDDGMLDEGTTQADIAEMLTEMQTIAELVEDEVGTRFTRADDSELEGMVQDWFHHAALVPSRHGEDA